MAIDRGRNGPGEGATRRPRSPDGWPGTSRWSKRCGLGPSDRDHRASGKSHDRGLDSATMTSEAGSRPPQTRRSGAADGSSKSQSKTASNPAEASFATAASDHGTYRATAAGDNGTDRATAAGDNGTDRATGA